MLAAAQAPGTRTSSSARARCTIEPGRLVLIVVTLTAGHDAADVDGRADHEARHRQRHLAADLRLDPHLRAGRASTPGSTAAPIEKLFFPLVAIGIVVAVVFVQEGQRRIPIQYAKRMVGRRQTAGGATYMPLRVNMAGVIPVIFAAALHGASRRRSASSSRRRRASSTRTSRRRTWTYLADRGAADHRLHVLLHGGPVQPGRPGRQPAQVRRLHPGHPARPADRAVPRPRADAADAARLAVPRRRSRSCRRSSSATAASRRRPRARSAAPRC